MGGILGFEARDGDTLPFESVTLAAVQRDLFRAKTQKQGD